MFTAEDVAPMLEYFPAAVLFWLVKRVNGLDVREGARERARNRMRTTDD